MHDVTIEIIEEGSKPFWFKNWNKEIDAPTFYKTMNNEYWAIY